MKLKTKVLCSAAPVALMVAFATPLYAGEILGFEGVSGDGYVFSDPAEGVNPPGVKAVTTDINNDDYASDNGFSPAPSDGETYNCLMANNDLT